MANGPREGLPCSSSWAPQSPHSPTAAPHVHQTLLLRVIANSTEEIQGSRTANGMSPSSAAKNRQARQFISVAAAPPGKTAQPPQLPLLLPLLLPLPPARQPLPLSQPLTTSARPTKTPPLRPPRRAQRPPQHPSPATCAAPPATAAAPAAPTPAQEQRACVRGAVSEDESVNSPAGTAGDARDNNCRC